MAQDARDDYQLDGPAQEKLRALLAEIRDRIVSRAAIESAGQSITAEDLDRSYDVFGFPQRGVLDAQSIVSTALEENRRVEWISYGMACALFIVGIIMVFVGMFGTTTAVQVSGIVAGTIFEILLLFPIRMAVNARRHNIAIRMLGILLDRVHDPKKLSQILAKHFKDILFPAAIGLEAG